MIPADLLKKSFEGVCGKVKPLDIGFEAYLTTLFPPEDAPLARTLYRARELAKLIIPEDKVDPEGLKKALTIINHLLEYRFLRDSFDRWAAKRMISLINQVEGSTKIKGLINAFSKDVSNAYIESVIQRSMGAHGETSDALVRQAVLSALLTPLRQNVGSCFATAPCIVIQDEQVENFLQDLSALVHAGTMRRIVQGKEIVVPFSLSSGVGVAKKRLERRFVNALMHHVKEKGQISDSSGLISTYLKNKPEKLKAIVDLTDHPLLKGWEYTIASLSDFKVEIFKWNVFASLGFDQKDRGGIGELILQHFNMRIEEKNAEIDELQREVEHAYSRMKMTETLLRQADSREKARRLQAEHASNVDHFHAVKDQRDTLANLGEHFQKLFHLLLKVYTDKVGEEFQELYDADIAVDGGGVFEDAPAGFRLLYKHGRSDPISWSFIYDEVEYTKALESFFTMVEPEVVAACETDAQKKEVSLLTTKIVYHVRSDLFLQSAHHRIRTFHAKHNIDSRGYKKPWVYTSGGTMEGLIHAYYGEEKEFSKERSMRHNALDLLTFYVDEMKELSGTVSSLFEKKKERRMLATSPNHAFTLMPGTFLSEWNNQRFSYTWIRDRFFYPAREYYRKIHLTQTHVASICKTLEIPEVYVSGSIQEVFKSLRCDPSQFDSVLYASLPFDGETPYHTAQLFSNMNRRPKCVQIGDTNWSTYFFSFVVNPRTLEVELWRTDPDGIWGLPMREWDEIFAHPKREWELFVNPKEYGTVLDRGLENTTRKV